MSQQKLLEKVIDVLNQNEIQYMITGSIVSSMQGEPRLTHDIDIVVTIEKAEAISYVRPVPHMNLNNGLMPKASKVCRLK